MPDIDQKPDGYRGVGRPKASRLNAFLVLGICLLVSPALVVVSLKEPGAGALIVISLMVGVASGWAITRIADPKPYIPEDDPARLQNPAPKSWVGKMIARPAGWDAKGAWGGRMIAAILMGLTVYWVRTHT